MNFRFVIVFAFCGACLDLCDCGYTELVMYRYFVFVGGVVVLSMMVLWSNLMLVSFW